MPIYGSPNYSMGLADANAPLTARNAAKAKADLARMKRSLRSWLHYRGINDAVMSGRGAPDALLKRPGARPPAPADVAARLMGPRRADEQRLATNLYRLLSEVFDAGDLPSPDIAENPHAAVELAQIAIDGKLPGETGMPTPQGLGFIWLWPAVVVVGVLAMVITIKIRSDADVAKEREKFECIQSGKCTDSGFWLKAAAIGIGGWFLWDKAGLRERVQGVIGRKGAAGRR